MSTKWEMQPNERRLLGFDCGPDLLDGDSVASVTTIVAEDESGTDASSIVGTSTISDAIINWWAEHPATEGEYLVTANYVTTLGEELEVEGVLVVKEKGWA